MKSGSSITDTWVRPVGRTDIASVMGIQSSQIRSDIDLKGKRPGDLFRTSDDAPIGSVRLTEEKNDKKGFGRW